MITKFRLFESINKLPEIGDYVAISADALIDLFDTNYDSKDSKDLEDIKKLSDFYKNNVGKIISYTDDENYYNIQWEHTPKLFGMQENWFKQVKKLKNSKKHHISWFLCWSDKREELEAYLSAKKYNL